MRGLVVVGQRGKQVKKKKIEKMGEKKKKEMEMEEKKKKEKEEEVNNVNNVKQNDNLRVPCVCHACHLRPYD